MDAERELQEYSQTKMSRGRRVVGRILVWTFRAFVFTVISLVLWRVLFSDRIPTEAQTLTVNDTTYAAYGAQGDAPDAFCQAQETLTYTETDTGIYGLFWANQTVFLPKASQIQLLTRYNNSTLDYLTEDFKLKQIPDREDDILDVTLRVTTDPTPDLPRSGDEQTARYFPSAAPLHYATSIYNYRKFVFDGIDLNDPNILEISVDFYYVGQVDYDSIPYGTLRLYSSDFDVDPYRLTARDKRALAQYQK